MKKLTTNCITILVLMVLCVGPAYSQGKESLSATEILARVSAVYSSCRTYSDEGQVNRETVYGSFHRPDVQPFFTAFVRPSSFRFEVRTPRGTEYWDRFIAWKEGDVEKSWWSLNQHQAPLAGTLRSFAGLSKGTAQTVPALLLPNLFPAASLITSLEDPKLKGSEKLDGRPTLKIEGKYDGKLTKLWIDSREFLILKIFTEERSDPFKIETTTKYKPQVNLDVAADKLAFNPPADSANGASARTAPGKDGRSNLPSRPALHFQNETKSGDYQLSLVPKKEKPNQNDADKPGNGKEKVIDTDEVDIVRVETTLVALDVLVLDKQGRFIKGLTGNDFAVTEDGQPQQVTTFALGDDLSRPRTIILIIDYSGSQLAFIKNSVEAARNLVDQLNPKDRMAIVTDDISVLADFTQDKDELKRKLDSLWKVVAHKKSLGRSLQYSALMATLDGLSKEPDVHPIIIFQTDGDELPALRQVASYPPPIPMAAFPFEKAFSMVDVFSTALSSRATIYTVIPGIRLIGLPLNQQLSRAKTTWEIENAALEELRPDLYKLRRPIRERNWTDEDWQNSVAYTLWTQTALMTLSQVTGGWADFLEQSEQAADIYARILSDINRRYIVGYQPANKERDGKLRKVTVEVRGHEDYIVHGRKSYYAPGPER